MVKMSKTGTDVKNRILIATLEIIKTQGMRAVRHRAVASLAGVSLGSTTYHFKSIEDLISSAFVFWQQSVDVGSNPFFLSLADDVAQLAQQQLSREEFAVALFKDSEIYFMDQVLENTDDRRIELAFHHEALNSPQLSTLLLKSWGEEVNRLTRLFELMATDSPKEDAEITFAIIMQLEKKAMLLLDVNELQAEYEKIRKILKRHIYLLAGVTE